MFQMPAVTMSSPKEDDPKAIYAEIPAISHYSASYEDMASVPKTTDAGVMSPEYPTTIKVGCGKSIHSHINSARAAYPINNFEMKDNRSYDNPSVILSGSRYRAEMSGAYLGTEKGDEGCHGTKDSRCLYATLIFVVVLATGVLAACIGFSLEMSKIKSEIALLARHLWNKISPKPWSVSSKSI